MESFVGCFESSATTTARETCSQCRYRKVRCDRRNGTCTNCERLNLACSLATPSAGLDHTALRGKPRRLRGTVACVACREKKIKCSATTPQCTNCKRQGRPCAYPTLKRPLRNHGADAPSAASSTQSQLSPPEQGDIQGVPSPSHPITEEMLVLVDAFFENIYPLPSYAFLHPETTKRRCRDAQVHRALASAVCAIAAFHMGRDRQMASRWIQGAEQSIWLHLGSPTIPRLQTLLLVIHFRMETGAFQRAFMLTATAARFAAAMRLNYERPDLDPVSREVRRRIVWSLKIMERYFSIGLPEFELCPIESIYLEYPSPEEQFEAKSQGENGAYRLLVRLETIRRDVMKLNRSVAPLDEPLPSLIKLIRHHQQSLSDIGMAMPEGTQLTESQTLALLGSPWLPRRIQMHISWHQAHCDLNRILLSGYPEAAPAVVLEAVDRADLAEGEQQCLQHATSIIQILTTLNQQSTQRQSLEFDTAICVYHAARLILFISRFGRDPGRPAPEFAASRAELCLTALKRFFPTSALVAPIIEELQRSIGVFSQQQDDRASARQPPATETPRHRDLESQLSAAARARQRLAIHSLLRQAEFSDGDDDEEHEREPGFIEEGSAQEFARADDMEEHVSVRSPEALSTGNQRSSTSSGGGIVHPTVGEPGFGASDWHASAGSESSPNIEQVATPLLSWFGPQDWDWLSSRGT